MNFQHRISNAEKKQSFIITKYFREHFLNTELIILTALDSGNTIYFHNCRIKLRMLFGSVFLKTGHR